MVSTISKWRNVVGELDKSGSYDDLLIRDMQLEGEMMDVSSEFVAISWKSSGGCVAVFNARQFERAMPDIPLIRGHEAPVLDVKFSPFSPDILATGGDDAVVKIWQIPEGGLKTDLTQELQKFSLHDRKLIIVNFHPTVKEIIASCAQDQLAYVWDITNTKVLSKIALEDFPQSLEWNPNGSLLCATTRDQLIKILDPRLSENQIVHKTKGHEHSTKSGKSGFLDENYIYSAGFSQRKEREVRLFDIRKFDAPVDSHKVDTQTGSMHPYLDTDSNLLFLPGRGESNISFVDLNDHKIKSGGSYTSSVPQKSCAFFPKRTMDYNKSEIARCAKLCSNHLEYISFRFPRRHSGFNPEFYPDCLDGTPTNTVEEWLKGENKEANRRKITEIENKFTSEVITIEKKEEKLESNSLSNEELVKQNQQLHLRVKELEDLVSVLRLKLEAAENKAQQEQTKEEVPQQEEPKNEEPKQEEPKNEEAPQEGS